MRETGVGIQNPLFFIGVVENALDPRHENRVQVRAFGIHGTVAQIPTEDLPWAICVAGNYHMNNLPQMNHWVFGMFIDGRDAQQPLVLGTIPTFMNETVDPGRAGYGKLPTNVEEQVLNGGKPESVGKPPMNDLASGETPQDTTVLEHEMNRIKDVRVAQDPDNPTQQLTSWSETPTAYAAKYGFNRVYDSPDGKTTVELDSTPGAERLMINHRGSYIQVDSNGTRTDKSYGDHQEVNDKNNMIYIGGQSSVTIMGNSYVYVDGNKIEEINGDLIQVVHGNHILGVGGQSTINSSEEVQIRGAQLRLESNVTGINLKAAKGIFAETGESVHIKSGIAIFQEAANSFNMKAGDNIYIQAAGDSNISATTVNIDDKISMANGDAKPATAANPSKSVEAPEPPAKSTSSTAKSRNRPNVSTAGAASVDDTAESESTAGTDDVLGDSEIPEFTTGTPSPGLTPKKADEIKKLALKYNINPNALAGILSIESNFDPNIRGGAGNNFYGIFQLQNSQIAGLTEQAFGRSLSVDEYRNLSFGDQLKVYEKYITNAGASRSFFTGDAAQDASRLWALQLAPSNARSIDYSNPNAVISRTNQANSIEARQGLVTVGSVQNYTISRGNLP